MKKTVTYESELFRYLLIVILLAFLLVNFIGLLNGAVLALIAISLQGTILVLMALKHPLQIILIRIWAILISLAGLTGTIAVVAYVAAYRTDPTLGLNPKANPLYAGVHILEFLAGMYFLVRLSKSIKVKTAESGFDTSPA